MRLLLLMVMGALLSFYLEAKVVKNKKYCFKVEIPADYQTTEKQTQKGLYILETWSADKLSHLYLIAVKAGEGSKYKWSDVEKLDSMCFSLPSAKEKESKPVYSRRIKRSYPPGDGWASETTTIYAKDYCYVFLHLYKESAEAGNEIIDSFSASHANGVLNFIELLFSRISEGKFMSFLFFIFQLIWGTALFFISFYLIVIDDNEKGWFFWVKIIAGLAFFYLALHDPLVDFIEGYTGIEGFMNGVLEMFVDGY